MAKEISVYKQAQNFLATFRPPEDDMAVIRLEEAVAFSDSVQPICLPLEYRENVGEYAVVVGYGAYNFTGPGVGNTTKTIKDGMLRENIVPFRATGKCLVSSFSFDMLQKFTLFQEEPFEHGENGDSGGPLLVNRRGQWFEVGLCHGTDGKWKGEAMYNRISPKCDWIGEVTNAEVECIELH
ncbi:serine proteinase stubble-like protein [Aphelenchoides avenae]|nr:serine proteinase stubble-like protein [Aphelenchus avenae]